MAGAEGSCGVCGTPAKLRCGGCSNVFYCSREHQRKHWAKHRDECRPVQEVQNETEGRHLIASRNLKAGQLVLKEIPVVTGPAGTCYPMCLGCHKTLTNVDEFRCPGCFWPMCSPECHLKELHIKECSILAQDVKRLSPPSSPDITARYDLILLIRCLLLNETNPAVWDRLLSMESHMKARKWQQEPYHMAAVRFLTEIVKSGYDAETVHKVRGIMITNCINIRGPNGEHLRGIYPSIALLNHSCTPNLTIWSGPSDTLFIRTCVAVNKGENLVFSYTAPEEPLWQRHFDLKNIYFFTCKCRRCQDPTELGTHFSSPRCPKCPEKFLEPRDGLDTPWKCPECEEKRESQDITDEAERYIKTIEERCGSPADVESLMADVSNTFHDRHYVWVTAAQAALRNIKKDTSIESLKLQRDLWKGLMAVYQVFEPGLTRRRGVTLFQVSVLETRVAQTQFNAGELTRSSYASALRRIVRQLEFSAQVLSLEPPNSSEAHWKERADTHAAALSEVILNLEQGEPTEEEAQIVDEVKSES